MPQSHCPRLWAYPNNLALPLQLKMNSSLKRVEFEGKLVLGSLGYMTPLVHKSMFVAPFSLSLRKSCLELGCRSKLTPLLMGGAYLESTRKETVWSFCSTSIFVMASSVVMSCMLVLCSCSMVSLSVQNYAKLSERWVYYVKLHTLIIILELHKLIMLSSIDLFDSLFMASTTTTVGRDLLFCLPLRQLC